MRYHAYLQWVRMASRNFSPDSSENAYCGFLPDLRHNGEFYLSFLDIKNTIGRVALSKDRLLFGKSCDLSTAVDGRKECLGIELDEFLGRYHSCHDWPPLKSCECAEAQLPMMKDE